MDFYEVLQNRRTIREFEECEISDEVINRIIKSAFNAPSNDHLRDWHYMVIKDKEVILNLIKGMPKKFNDYQLNRLFKAWNLTDENQQKMYSIAVPKQYEMFSKANCLVIPLLKQKTDILKPANISHLNGFASIWCSIENMLLSATYEGYAFSLRIPLGKEADDAKELLGIPDEYLVPCFLGLGKKAHDATEIVQKDIDIESRMHINKW